MLVSLRPLFARLIAACISCLFFYQYWTIFESQSISHRRPLPSEIPKKIWYKLGPRGQSDESRKWTSTCLGNNPEYDFQFMTDATGDRYVQRVFRDRPDIVDTYLHLPIPILKADFLRYMLLFAEGGIWSDLDVSCEGTPIREWIPQRLKPNTSLVVGWEFDGGYDANILRQFTSWTIMAKPRLSHMWTVIEDIMGSISETTARHNVSVGDLNLSMIGDVVDFTGPRRLTRSIFQSLENNLNATIDWRQIVNLTEPKLLDDVLILPGYSFAASMNSYEDQAVLGPKLVTHHYAGSWKNDDGGETIVN
jgi:alpha 1,6-mannosyltransferase